MTERELEQVQAGAAVTVLVPCCPPYDLRRAGRVYYVNGDMIDVEIDGQVIPVAFEYVDLAAEEGEGADEREEDDGAADGR